MAFAVAVRAAKTCNWRAVFADAHGGFAFLCFVPLFAKNFYDFCSVAVKQVVDMPEQVLFTY